MNGLTLERRLDKSTNSIRAIALALVGTALLFSGMSISRLGKVDTQEEVMTAQIDVYLPPPPPPPPPEPVEEVEVSQVPIQVDVALNPDPVKLTVSPIETTLDAPSSISDRIEVSLSEFNRPSVEVDLSSIVFEKSEVDQLPEKSFTPMPTMPSKIRKEVGDARIIVQLSIDQKGKPLHVMVLNSPVPEARPYIIRDLKKWRFRPAKRDGQKVNCWVRFVLVYEQTSSSPFSL